MKPTLTDKQCADIFNKYGIPTTGHIAKAALFAALREAFHHGHDVDVVKMRYKKATAKELTVQAIQT